MVKWPVSIHDWLINCMRRDREVPQNKKKNRHLIVWITFLELVILIAGLTVLLLPREQDKDVEALLEQDVSFEPVEEESETEGHYVPRPEVDHQFLTPNEYSRPGDPTKKIEYIVIHYLANPGTTAQENRDYFDSLKDLKTTYMSANYVIGLEGEIIQCVPDNEVAYASNERNEDSISIENCHKDTTGKFTEDTYNSLVKLTAFLAEKYGIDREHIIRHHDVTGKDCPKYYVENEDKWEEFKDDVFLYQKECEEKYKPKPAKVAIDEGLADYLESIAETESEE